MGRPKEEDNNDNICNYNSTNHNHHHNHEFTAGTRKLSGGRSLIKTTINNNRKILGTINAVHIVRLPRRLFGYRMKHYVWLHFKICQMTLQLRGVCSLCQRQRC